SELQWDLIERESHQGIQKLVSDLNQIYRREPSLHEVDFESQGFEWIDSHNSHDSVLVYVRRAKNPEDFVLVICNFTPVVRENYRLGA
ncbi:MAG TPA: 1,4-alpha-glucan branching enzyme, partial [Planctomycetaceae bacterium]|nr:1,4-alpha-glucan branching enzyme [Planctomycetaceae bacterium]